MSFYLPSSETLSALQGRWIASYSGGKDSTSLVTWLEWLRRTGQLKITKPMLVQSDTGVEYPFIQETTSRLLDVLTKSGWNCNIVRPDTPHKLFCQIFGRGLPPVHPANRKGRWCTRATKVDPMRRFRSNAGEKLQVLTGVRWGESANRDEKLKVAGCSAGGECGTDIGGEDVYSPIINWTTCQVFDWLNGLVGEDLRIALRDIFPITRTLAGIYKPADSDADALRFGCVACPALSRDKVMDSAAVTDARYRPLQAIYGLWASIYRPEHRLCMYRRGKFILGPIRMAWRKVFFERFLAIQNESGVVLVTPEDIEFIRDCWARGVYPRGWSAEDEITSPLLLERHRSPLFHLTVEGEARP